MSYLIVNAARSAGTIRKTIYGQFSDIWAAASTAVSLTRTARCAPPSCRR